MAAILHTTEAFTWLEEAPYPTIAAVRGHALGAGMQLALACDIRVVARSAQFGLLEHRYGLIPDLGGTQRLPRLVGAGKAKELIFTAKIIDAEEAQRLGMVEQLVDVNTLEQTAADLANQIAAQPPLCAPSETSDQCRARYTDTTRIAPQAEGQAPCIRSDDFKEAIRAYKERQIPHYKGR